MSNSPEFDFDEWARLRGQKSLRQIACEFADMECQLSVLRADLARATAQGMLKAIAVCEAKELEHLNGDGNTRTVGRAEGCCDCQEAIRSEASRLEQENGNG